MRRTSAASPLPPPGDQADVLSFLEHGSAYGHLRPSRRIDTHAASVFLAGTRAWKLKRAVRFDYLDFSTPELRRKALETELRLNRRTAPDMYLGVRPVTRDPGGNLRIGGTGEAVDWLLEMRRFADGALLSERAEVGLLDDRILTDLADGIAAFHDAADAFATDTAADRLLHVLRGNAACLTRYPRMLDPGACDRLVRRQQEQLEMHRALLDRRGREGCVVHGHGDLHLANIAVVEGVPRPFDCLEFDADLATIDRLYDLAFLLMDLWSRGLRRECAVVVNRTLDLRASDETGLPLLPLFMSLRATIRAHVSASLDERDPGAATGQPHHYLELAWQLLAEDAPRLIAIGGLSGTGKSSLSRVLCGFGRAPGARILRSDVLRKRIAGVGPEQRLDPARYSAEANKAVYREMATLAERALSAGHSVIADAVFADPGERVAIESASARAGAAFEGIWLEASQRRRVARVRRRSGDASDAGATVARQQQSYCVGELRDWHRCDASRPLAAVAASARRLLSLGMRDYP